MKIVVLSCSLKEASRSRVLALEAQRLLHGKELKVEFVDMCDYPLPFCNAGDCYQDEDVQHLQEILTEADGILVACPIYNFTVNAVFKNLVELTGRAWQDKVVGFINAAGGKSSYMAIMGMANSLMLDFRSMILPRFLYTCDEDFSGAEIVNDKIHERLALLCDDLVRVTAALRGPS